MGAVRLDPDRASWLVMSGRVDHPAVDAFARALLEGADHLAPRHRDGGRLPDSRSLAELITHVSAVDVTGAEFPDLAGPDLIATLSTRLLGRGERLLVVARDGPALDLLRRAGVSAVVRLRVVEDGR
jgi:hypothetical protein